ncbi:MAG: cyclopropane fatty acyl phospholipid synthase [Deltaproteobacteria bacterium]|nr:cyclopropane fatty acyl phospholipid synthase [Deltaproteobacteria bacterium]
MREQRVLFGEILSRAGITIDGPNPWDIQVKDETFFVRLLRDNSLGLGEAYMEGLWECRRIDEFICRILRANLDEEIRGGLKFLLPYMSALLFNSQTRRRAHVIADRHYDLGNDLFFSFLDPYNQYSCGYFNGTDDLAQAQQNKLALICRKLDLKPTDHLLDIGCGWGGLAKYAAEHYGCTVTGVTISREQVRHGAAYGKDLPVRIRECEYRDIQGSFDKVVSVGMFEHVGQKNFPTFMGVVHRCLKDDGIFLLHTIGGNRSQVKCEPWIGKYIFPNSMLPSIAQIGKATEDFFVMEDWHNLGPHYDKTLMAWHDNFQNNWGRLEGKYDNQFKRMWEYYLLSCAGAFRARNIQLWQIVLTKRGRLQPDCRKQ